MSCQILAPGSRRTDESVVCSLFRRCISDYWHAPGRQRTDESVVCGPFRRCISDFRHAPGSRRTDEKAVCGPFRRCISDYRHALGSRRTDSAALMYPFHLCAEMQISLGEEERLLRNSTDPLNFLLIVVAFRGMLLAGIANRDQCEGNVLLRQVDVPAEEGN